MKIILARIVVFIVFCVFNLNLVYAETYKVGLTIPITGPGAALAAPYKKGVEDYIHFANSQNILGKNKVKLLIRDTAYKVDLARKHFEELLDKEVLSILGLGTGATLAIKQDLEEEKLTLIAGSLDSSLLKDSNYIFLPSASYDEQLIGLLQFIAKKETSKVKVAMILHASAYGRAPLKKAKETIKKKGWKIQIVEVVEHGQELDRTAILNRLARKEVQYIITHTFYPYTASFLRDAQRLKMLASFPGEKGKMTFLGTHYTGGQGLLKLAETASSGFLWVTSFESTYEKHEGTNLLKKLGKQFNRKPETTTSVYYANGVMVAQVFVGALKQAQEKHKKIDRQTLYQTLNQMNGKNALRLATTVGPVTFSKNDRKGVDQLKIFKAHSGQFISFGEPFSVH